MKYRLCAAIVFCAGCAGPSAPTPAPVVPVPTVTVSLSCVMPESVTIYPSGWALSADGRQVYDTVTCHLAATIPPCYFYAEDGGLLACP